MNDDFVGAGLALRLTQQHVDSARPDAPVVPDRPRRRPLLALRSRFAAELRRLASRIEPASPSRDACAVG